MTEQEMQTLIDAANAERDAAKKDVETITAERDAITAERDAAKKDVETITAERDAAKKDVETITAERDKVKAEYAAKFGSDDGQGGADDKLDEEVQKHFSNIFK